MRTLLLAGCLLLLGCPDKGPTPEQQKAHVEGVYLTATAAFMKGDFAEAHKNLDEVKALAPDDPRIPAAEGEIFLGEYKFDEALAAFQKAVKIDPRRPTNYSRIGYIQSLKGDRAGALLSLTKALELNPRDFNAHESLGDLQLKDGKWEDAVQSFMRGAEVGPDGVKGGLVMRAVQELGKHGQDDRALSTLEAAHKQGIVDTVLLTELGDALVRKGRLPDAIEAYTAAAKTTREDATLWELVGELYAKLDKPGDAEAAFRESLKVQDRGVVHVSLARLCEKRKDQACFKSEVDLALEKSTGEDPREVLELSELLISIGRKPDALKLLAQYASEDAQKADIPLQLKVARLAKEVGDKTVLKSACEVALASDAGVKKCP